MFIAEPKGLGAKRKERDDETELNYFGARALIMSLREKILLSLILLTTNVVIAIVILGFNDLFLLFTSILISFLIPFILIVILEKENTYQSILNLFSSKRPKDDSDIFDEALGLKPKDDSEMSFDDIVKKKNSP